MALLPTTDGDLTVTFLDPNNAAEALVGLGVHVEFRGKDEPDYGGDAIGEWHAFVNANGEWMVEITEVLDPERIVCCTFLSAVHKVTVL